jgi:hypothetical protein
LNTSGLDPEAIVYEGRSYMHYFIGVGRAEPLDMVDIGGVLGRGETGGADEPKGEDKSKYSHKDTSQSS